MSKLHNIHLTPFVKLMVVVATGLVLFGASVEAKFASNSETSAADTHLDDGTDH